MFKNVDAYQAYLDKHFEQGEEAWADELGSTLPGRYKVKIIGIYGQLPHEYYIVRWIDRPVTLENWEASVLTKACIFKVKEND